MHPAAPARDATEGATLKTSIALFGLAVILSLSIPQAGAECGPGVGSVIDRERKIAADPIGLISQGKCAQQKQYLFSVDSAVRAYTDSTTFPGRDGIGWGPQGSACAAISNLTNYSTTYGTRIVPSGWGISSTVAPGCPCSNPNDPATCRGSLIWLVTNENAPADSPGAFALFEIPWNPAIGAYDADRVVRKFPDPTNSLLLQSLVPSPQEIAFPVPEVTSGSATLPVTSVRVSFPPASTFGPELGRGRVVAYRFHRIVESAANGRFDGSDFRASAWEDLGDTQRLPADDASCSSGRCIASLTIPPAAADQEAFLAISLEFDSQLAIPRVGLPSAAIAGGSRMIPPPVVTSFALDGGEIRTTSREVMLDTTVDGSADELLASENPSFAGATWQPWSAEAPFFLSNRSGPKTIYLKLRNAGGESAVATDTIVLSGPR
jgi:hypothetical protein